MTAGRNGAAERSFSRGLAALSAGKTLEALAYFEASLRLEEESRNDARRARVASYYGYCLAAALGRVREGLALCRKAAESGFYSPQILANLIRVLLLAGERKEAWETMKKALTLDPNDEELKKVVRHMGVRRRPVIPFLSRDNLLNRMAGRIVSRRRGAKK